MVAVPRTLRAFEPLALLQRLPPFADLPDEVRAPVAGAMSRVEFSAGAVAVREGDPGDCFYIIQEGHAEVSVRGSDGSQLVVAALGAGEPFGEIALVRQSARTATVRAITRLVCYRMDASAFMGLLRDYPAMRRHFDKAAQRLEVLNFLKRAMPFSPLSVESMHALSSRLRERHVAAGEVIVRQGEPGDAFYLVREGRVEVYDEESHQGLSILGSGDCFGEMALLSDDPRAATVRALEHCRLLVLERHHFTTVLESHEHLHAGLTALATARYRPRRAAQWTIQQQQRADGEVIYVLKDEVTARYFCLSQRGRFIWDCIDGSRTVRDLLLEYRARYKVAGAGLVYPLLARLQAQGFVTVPRTRTRRVADEGISGAGTAAAAHRILTAQYTVGRFDEILTALYRRIGRFSYTRPAQALWLLLTLVGGAAFLYLWTGKRVDLAASGNLGWLVPVIVVVGWLIHVPLHEMQHALTAKHYGREVRRAGAGWYWFAPMFWTDTSDIWMEGRWRRMAVSFAGPYSNLIMGGALSLVVFALSDGVLRSGLFDMTLVLYVGFLTAFNPLMEYDGYYMLEDFLETSNLRRKAMAFLALDFVSRLRARHFTRPEQGYAVYGLCALAYVAFMCSQIVLIYRTRVEHSVAMHVPQIVAATLGWGLAALFLVLVGLGTVHDILQARAARRIGATPTMAAVAALAGEPALPTEELERQLTDGGEALEARISK